MRIPALPQPKTDEKRKTLLELVRTAVSSKMRRKKFPDQVSPKK